MIPENDSRFTLETPPHPTWIKVWTNIFYLLFITTITFDIEFMKSHVVYLLAIVFFVLFNSLLVYGSKTDGIKILFNIKVDGVKNEIKLDFSKKRVVKILQNDKIILNKKLKISFKQPLKYEVFVGEKEKKKIIVEHKWNRDGYSLYCINNFTVSVDDTAVPINEIKIVNS